MDYMGIVFNEGPDQRERFNYLYQCTLTPTRYADETCLHALGLYDSVCFMHAILCWD